MGLSNTSSVSVVVPKGEGHIIGDILRKYATRGTGSWQAIGYKVASQSPNFGFSDGKMVSYLEFLPGTLVCTGGDASSVKREARLCKFDWNGKCFAADGFELHGLNPSVGESLVVCINFAQGSRSANQNLEVVRNVFGGDVSGYYVVPSSHSPVRTFKYKVTPIDENTEWLQIEADEGVARGALSVAVKSLAGLDI